MSHNRFKTPFAICILGGFLLSAGIASAQTALAAAPKVLPAGRSIPGATTVFVPGGTSVNVSLRESISSATATVGDTVAILVSKEVDSNGYLVVPKGANGQATVTAVERAGGNGHGGKLAMSVDWVFSADGGKIQLSSVNHSAENGDQKGASSTATIATWLLLGPLGLFAHNWVHGKDVAIGTDHVFSVFVDHDVHVQAMQKSTAASGFDN